jgi:hypothetical protein
MLSLMRSLERRARGRRTRKLGKQAVTGPSFLGLIAVTVALMIEFPPLALLGFPAIVILAVAAVFVVASVVLIPAAYLIY